MTNTRYELYADLKERYDARCKEFHEGTISEPVFRVYAKQFGFSPRDIEAEVELHKPDRKEICQLCFGRGLRMNPSGCEPRVLFCACSDRRKFWIDING